MTIRLEIYIDGGAKGNPGPSGIGVIICRDGEVIKNVSEFIGKTTNNVAEYTALIYGLQEALILKAASVTVYTDSQLLYRQLRHEYKIKNSNLIGLYNQVRLLLSGIASFEIRHIPREKNSGADKLVKKAIREATRKKSLIIGDEQKVAAPD